MTEVENQSPALAWLTAAIMMPQFFNQEMQKHVANVNQVSTSQVNEIDK